jgi:3-deoxy-D-manno-octulosonic-acid transferase
MTPARLLEEKRNGIAAVSMRAHAEGCSRAWFHAASVGELESLVPVILEWVKQGSECVITALSESANGALRSLRRELATFESQLVFVGYSPWEGRWREALAKVKPDVFVTAKYEAWPELWGSLSSLNIPLVLVSAKARRSLRMVQMLCRILGVKLPKMDLLTVNEKDAEELEKVFRHQRECVRIQVMGEPRWDRVLARANRGSVRANELIEMFKDLPRPWGILGSVWPEDLQVWRGRFASSAGTLWVVPHRVEQESVDEIEGLLKQSGMRVGRTSRNEVCSGDRRIDCILVDEIGVLLELYAVADWVYVGGGFGVSMHSTIEPALFGVPIACGPNGVDKFPEIQELGATGQLEVLHDAAGLDHWLSEEVTELRRADWKAQANKRFGASQRVLQVVNRAAIGVNLVS